MCAQVQDRGFLAQRGSQPVKYRWNGQEFDSLEALQAAMAGGGGQIMGHASGGQATLDRINAILDDGDKFKDECKAIFRSIAGADMKLQQNEIGGLKGVLSSKWGIDGSYFDNMNEMFYRFDYSGSGHLDHKEVADLIKFVLKEQRRELAPPKPGTRLAHLPQKNLKQHFQLTKKFGEGGQGAVWGAKEIATGTSRVVKFYTKGQADVDDIKDEFDLLKKLDHPHVARICEAFEDLANIYVVSEPYTGGDLTTVTQKAQEHGVVLTHEWLGKIFLQCLGGLGYLHSKKTMHCDIKEANIMIADGDHWEEPHVMLIDFGMAKSFHGSRMGGTPGYIPPEVWCHQLWTPKGDMFAFAITMWGIYNFCQGGPFVQNLHEAAMYPRQPCCFPGMEAVMALTIFKPLDCSRLPSGDGGSRGLRELVQQMAEKDFRQRPTAPQVMDTTYFRNVSKQKEPLDAKMVANLKRASKRTSCQNLFALEFANRKNLGQMKSLNSLFRQFDKDGTGSIGREDAFTALHSMGFDRQACNEMVDSLIGEDDKMRYSEFMARMIASNESMTNADLAQVFKGLDTDGNGTLSLSELNELLKKPNMESLVDGRSAEDLIREMDVDGDGVIGFEEFRLAMVGESPTPSCHFSVGDPAEYMSRSAGDWIACKITKVDKRTGKVQIDVKPGAWVRPDKEVRKVHHDESAHSPHDARFKTGDSAEYYSASYGKWVPCEITDVDTSNARVQISVKPGFWMDRAVQAKSLRKSKGEGGY